MLRFERCLFTNRPPPPVASGNKILVTYKRSRASERIVPKKAGTENTRRGQNI
ncbi:Hypothetical predicted protein [Podarcis lilfordi]|uniref:Uncharacterized protein n=1 Tax=Podarcis lilfordi TaxID=74358 RepID=A0AA35P2N9_9SAUR|nr:Hypothetical predicted protein [Podarcis lilfordi]